jgi:hypothetical protein
LSGPGGTRLIVAALAGSSTTAASNSIPTRSSEPYAYLKDVLERMANGHPMRKRDDLLPWKWKAERVEN